MNQLKEVSTLQEKGFESSKNGSSNMLEKINSVSPKKDIREKLWTVNINSTKIS